MAGYEDTRQMIINTLTNRLAGTEIQPEDHQEFALAITDYVRSVELLSGNAFIGFAEANTTPVQSDNGQCFYNNNHTLENYNTKISDQLLNYVINKFN